MIKLNDAIILYLDNEDLVKPIPDNSAIQRSQIKLTDFPIKIIKELTASEVVIFNYVNEFGSYKHIILKSRL